MGSRSRSRARTTRAVRAAARTASRPRPTSCSLARTAELTLDLPAGRYKVECLVDGHDDLGMEGFLEVRRDAPMVEAPHGQSGSAPAVTI
jgi:hypothetical protein